MVTQNYRVLDKIASCQKIRDSELGFLFKGMKKLKGNKNTLKIVAATSVCLFSLLTVFSAAFAWFSMNQQTNGDGMNLQVKRLNGRLQTINCYPFNANASNETTLSFNKTALASYTYDWDALSLIPDANNPDVWEMGDFTSLDRDHPLLMIFGFDRDYESESEGDIYVRGVTTVGGNNLETVYTDGVPTKTNGGGYLGARNANGTPYYTLPQTDVRTDEHPERILIKQTANYDYYALSSVTSFRNRVFTDAQFTAFSNGANYSFATNTLESDESFTTIISETDNYVFNQTPYLFKSNGNESFKYIALIVEYSSEAISYIYSTYLGDRGLDSYESILHFACDWSLEVC